MWVLQLNYDKIFTKEFDLEISNLYDIIYLLFYITYFICFLLYNSSFRDNATYIAYILQAYHNIVVKKCCIFKDQTQGFSGSNGSISFIKIKNIIKDLLSILKLPITNPKYKSLFVFARLPKMWASSCTRVLTVLLLTGTI